MKWGPIVIIVIAVTLALIIGGIVSNYVQSTRTSTTSLSTSVVSSKAVMSTSQSVTKSLSSHKEVTVIDALGRKVTLPYPVMRAIVTDDEVAELVQIVGAADRVVGIEPSIKTRGYFPQMANKPITGSQFRGLNYELLMKLKPDVVIMMDVGPIGKIIQKLNKLGIKCVVISINPSKIPQTIRLLGKIFGKEKRAEELLKWWYQKWDELEKRLAPLKGRPKLKVFIGMGFTPSKKLPLHTWVS